ncbi:MAG TPA: phosphoribosylanthranilate isomerase [Ruminiclostridium sp.]|nr:phosphoribosylanthranilate isomerase [Ruminiclostridium sp.]
MMAEIKICGLRRREDIEAANRLRPDYIGFVFAKSRRRVTVAEASLLRENLDPEIGAVGVFVDEKPLVAAHAAIKCRLYAVQLHGSENAQYIKTLRRLLPKHCEIWKAAAVRGYGDIKAAENAGADRLLLDAYSPDLKGGTGKQFNWALLGSSEIAHPFFIAGGISCANIDSALKAGKESGQEFGIDISGGVETDGFKDFGKMAEVIGAVRRFA